MNERIRELKNQAMLFAQEKCEGQSRDMHGTLRADIMTEKFAELIVRECLTFVEPMPGSGDIDDLALEAAREGIKEHFGVEE
jgi:hypothetical protein